MAGKNRKELKKTETRLLPTKFTLLVRALVGAYLLYTSYSLIGGYQAGEGRDKVFFAIFMAAFAVIGISLIVLSARSYLYGKYVGGPLDAGEGEILKEAEEQKEERPEAIQEKEEER